jgi:hypothetical protein
MIASDNRMNVIAPAPPDEGKVGDARTYRLYEELTHKLPDPGLERECCEAQLLSHTAPRLVKRPWPLYESAPRAPPVIIIEGRRDSRS